MARATIKDIARAAQVSPMTVSNVINGRPAKASSDTVARINAAIAQLGYTPNMSARSLVSNASRMIGVIIPFTEDQNALLLDNPFYAEIVSGIETALRAAGYYMMLSGVGGRDAGLDILSSWNMDGLIVLGVYKEALYEQLKARNLPTLLIDSYIDDEHFYRLGIDDEQAAFEATSYLIANGHRDIALVTGVIRTDGVVERRVAGYRRALATAGIALDPALLFSGSVTFEWGAEAAAAIARNRAITAAFCTADLIAAGVLAGLHKAGTRIPDEVSVMGFDNLSISTMVYPALTTVDQSIAEKGRLAGELIAAILNHRTTARDTLVRTAIVVRDSVAPEALMDGVTGRGKYLALAILLLPSLVGMSVFYILPVLSSLVLSFSKWDLLTPIQWIGIDNYRAALADPTVLQALRNTLAFIVGYLPAVVAIGLALALLLNRRLKGRTVFRAIYFVPVVTSWVAVSLVWKWLLNPQYGLINFGLSLLGIKGPGWLFDPHWAMAGVVLTTIWKDIGFVTVIYLAGLQEIPENLGEAAELDGANAWQKFRTIIWPMLAPTTFFVTTISLISSFQVFDQVFIMTGGGPVGSTTTVVQLIYKNAFSYGQMGYASAISWVLFALIFTVTVAQNLLQKRLDRSDG